MSNDQIWCHVIDQLQTVLTLLTIEGTGAVENGGSFPITGFAPFNLLHTKDAA